VISHVNDVAVDRRVGEPRAQFADCLVDRAGISVPDRDTGARFQHACDDRKSESVSASGDHRVASLHIKLIHDVLFVVMVIWIFESHG